MDNMIPKLESKILIVKSEFQQNGNYYEEPAIPIRLLFALIAECYQKGVEIGWETKVLDLLNDSIRDATK